MNNYFLKIIFRQLTKNWQYSVINIVGLSIGMASFLIICTYLLNEINYDKWIENGDRIYRVALDHKMPDRTFSVAKIPHSIGNHLQTELAEVDASCRFFKWESVTVLLKKGKEVQTESHPMFADSTFFEVFDIEFLHGNSDKALAQPNSIVLTEQLAKKYFGNENPIGKTLKLLPDGGRLWDGNVDMTITGVCQNIPEQSHFNFDLILPSKILNYLQYPSYTSYTAYTYVLLNPEANAAALNEKFPNLVNRFAQGDISRNNQSGGKENPYHYYLQPVQDIHLKSNLEGELRTPGSLRKVKMFAAIAFFILLIAVINYMNLATAKSAERVREVGIRKTLGSGRSEIAIQFLMEAVVICALSFICCLGWLYLGLPIFGEYSGNEYSISQILEWRFVPYYLGFILLLGILSGSYPAFTLSAFSPAQVVKGKWLTRPKGHGLRNSLILFQFAISVFLFIGTIVVYNQVLYIQSKDLGFDKEHIVFLKGTRFLDKGSIEVLKDQLSEIPEVNCVGSGFNLPGGAGFTINFNPKGGQNKITGVGLIIDDFYLDCLNFEVLAGRKFSEDPNDTLAVVINEAAAKALGYKEPIGKEITSTDAFLQKDAKDPAVYKIIGLVKDFNFRSLRDKIEPFFFVHNKLAGGVDRMVYAKMRSNEVLPVIDRIETTWKNISPERPLDLGFLDEEMMALYESEQTFKNTFTAFALLAIFIACIGLFGLVSFIAEKRSKEISVRKVLGASAGNIVQLLLKDFLKLALLAFFVAIPFAYYYMNQWLENFAYRIDLQWWMFAIAGLSGVVITILTVSFHSIKVAIADPIDAIRQE